MWPKNAPIWPQNCHNWPKNGQPTTPTNPHHHFTNAEPLFVWFRPINDRFDDFCLKTAPCEVSPSRFERHFDLTTNSALATIPDTILSFQIRGRHILKRVRVDCEFQKQFPETDMITFSETRLHSEKLHILVGMQSSQTLM